MVIWKWQGVRVLINGNDNDSDPIEMNASA